MILWTENEEHVSPLFWWTGAPESFETGKSYECTGIVEGMYHGVFYQLVSGDFLKWQPYKVLETDIPYQYADRNLTIAALMKIRLQKRYAADRFTFERLKEDYGIYAVRGPRGIPNFLSAALKKAGKR